VDPRVHAWVSPETGREMRLTRYGASGDAMIYVPTSGGDEREFSRYGMPAVCEPWIAAGRLQVVAVDGSAPDTLWNDAIDPAERIRRYAAFERYMKRELLPWVAATTGVARPMVVGASYGAFVAANLLFKEPDRVRIACGLGGVYGLWHRLDGHHDEDVYFHTPLEYLPRLEDAAALEAIRRSEGLHIYAAESDEWLPSSLRMRDVLRRKRLPHSFEVWPAPADHHERWWRRQLKRFLERHVSPAPVEVAGEGAPGGSPTGRR